MKGETGTWPKAFPFRFSLFHRSITRPLYHWLFFLLRFFVAEEENVGDLVPRILLRLLPSLFTGRKTCLQPFYLPDISRFFPLSIFHSIDLLAHLLFSFDSLCLVFATPYSIEWKDVELIASVQSGVWVTYIFARHEIQTRRSREREKREDVVERLTKMKQMNWGKAMILLFRLDSDALRAQGRTQGRPGNVVWGSGLFSITISVWCLSSYLNNKQSVAG